MTHANREASDPSVPQDSILQLTQENRALQSELATVRARLLQVQEQERTTLAKDLHGGPIQELSSLLFELNLLQQFTQDAAGKEIVDSIKKNLKTAIGNLRYTINELRPASLYHFGLQPAIRTYADTLTKEHSHLNIGIVINSEDRLPTQIELALFRILQAALRNVVKHAQAQSLLIRLLWNETYVRFEVEDDGVGFTVPSQWDDLAQEGKMGLYIVAQQVNTLGGELLLRSAPDAGTLLRVTLSAAQGV